MTAAIRIAGAGVFGLATALALLKAGAAVTVVDPWPDGPNASAVAAGLLAPISEAVFDPVAAAHYPMMAAALALWPDFAGRHGVVLDCSGSVLLGEEMPTLRQFGAEGEPHPHGVLVQDFRVTSAATALSRLRDRVSALGGRIDERSLEPGDLEGQVVIAAGPGASAFADWAPELRVLSPIKGQIALAPHGPATGPVLRWPGGYLAPGAEGARIGATMEPGLTDIRIDPEVIQRLGEAARAHLPALELTGLRGAAGVRMATPDGAPLAGPSSSTGIWLAAGARRNGWLLAPLVGAVVAAYVTGGDPGAWARSMHPGRFAREGQT